MTACVLAQHCLAGDCRGGNAHGWRRIGFWIWMSGTTQYGTHHHRHLHRRLRRMILEQGMNLIARRLDYRTA